MYTETNFRTKKALRDALAAGREVSCYQPGGIFPGATDGPVSLEGPHYPAPHTWYASAVLKDSRIISLDGKSVEKLRAKYQAERAAAAPVLRVSRVTESGEIIPEK